MRGIVKRAALLMLAATFVAGMAVNLNPMNVLAVQQAEMPIVATEGTDSGRLGENDGFSYTYDADTKTLTITGEDSGLDLSQVAAEAEKIILSDCKLIGSADYLFNNLENLQSVEFDNFDTSEITSMQYMFSECYELTALDLRDFDTGNVTDMQLMFYDCNSLKTLDLSSFDTTDVIDMYGMFYSCDSLETVDLSSFDTSNAASVRDMFEYCDSLTTISAPKNMAEGQSILLPAMFGDENDNYTDRLTKDFCNKTLEKGIPTSGTLGESGGFSFSYDTDTKTLTVTGEDSGLDLGAVAAEAEKIVLKDCKLIGSANSLFYGLTTLQSVEFDNFDTSEITDMSYMFDTCVSLVDVDLNGFHTQKVTSMQNMFCSCVSLETIDLSSFDTSNVESLLNLFYGCNNLKVVDLSSFDTTNVSYLGSMFAYCNVLDTVSAPKAMAEGQSIELPYTFYDSERNSTEEITSAWCGKDLSVFLMRTGTMGDNNGFNYTYNETTRALTVTGEDSGLDLSEVKTELLELDLSDCVLKGDIKGLLNGCKNVEVIYTPKQLADGQSIALPGKFCDANWNITEEITSEHVNKVLKSAVKIELEYIYINTEGDNSRHLDIQYVPMGTVWGEFFENYEKRFNSNVITDADETITEWETWIQNRLYESEDDYFEYTISNFNQYTDCALVRFMGIPSNYKHGYVAFEYLVDGNHEDSGTGWDMILPAEYTYGSDEAIAYVTRNLKIHEYIMNYCNTPGAIVTITAPWPPTNEGQWEGYSVDIHVETPEAKVNKFVERMYTIVLNRPADENGVTDWTQMLLDKEADGALMANGFINSDEFVNRALNDSEYIGVLYLAFLNREADEGGILSWTQAMNNGLSRQAVLDGFINSAEFVGLCEDAGIRATLGKEDIVRNFVKRMYNLVLGRVADESGLDDWTRMLMNKEADGATLANGFVNSDEFVARGLSNQEYVNVMYATFLNRVADEGGINTWMTAFANGATRQEVLDGFVKSDEFGNICKNAGIVAVFTQEDYVRSFVERMYTVALNRAADVNGVEDWTRALINKEVNGAQMAAGFIDGDEFKARGLNDSDFVDVLYRTFFNREPDADKSVWTNALANGWTRREVLKGFANSAEFATLCERYGIVAGEMQ